jgi:hypothetical protein
MNGRVIVDPKTFNKEARKQKEELFHDDDEYYSDDDEDENEDHDVAMVA